MLASVSSRSTGKAGRTEYQRHSPKASSSTAAAAATAAQAVERSGAAAFAGLSLSRARMRPRSWSGTSTWRMALPMTSSARRSPRASGPQSSQPARWSSRARASVASSSRLLGRA